MSDVSSRRKWNSRLPRLLRRARLATADCARSLSWHVGGGRRFFSRFAPDLVAAHRWCFIVGCNNSGTSLLQSMLQQTEQVSTFALEGQLYTRVLRRSERRGYERVWMEYADDLALAGDAPLDEVPRLVHDWLGALPFPVHELIVEKTPANVLRLRWLQRAFSRCYFIGLVRNGYAVSEGIRRKGDKSLSRAASHWQMVNQTMLEQAEQVDNFMLVRYEDLVSSPYNEIQRLADFLQIGSIAVQRRSGSGSVREDHRTVQDFNVESISRLSEEDRRIVYENAAEMLDHFGYAAAKIQ